MEWLVGADGKYVPLTALQSHALELRATIQDLSVAYVTMREAIHASRSLVSDSRRWRRMRQSGLRVVPTRG
jgi:hypothetical protein